MARIKTAILSTLLCLIFLISGLVINFLQSILYLVLYNRKRKLYRKINYYLIYASWSQLVVLTEWWSGSSCNLYGTEEDLKDFGREHSIILMNHRYEIDWLMCWFVCEKLRALGNAKSCAKKSLQYVPIIGWSWVFAELIFLERNWDKDKTTFGAKLDKLVEYEDPIMLLFFAEGTRFTPEKHQASLKFAEENGLPKLKYHLLPRTKGFNYSVAHLKSKTNAIYDIQLAFPNDVRPSFYDILSGEKKFVGDLYVRRIPMSEIPTGSDKELTEFLYGLYKKKDELMAQYLETSTFPGKRVPLKRSPRSLINFIFWTVFVGVPTLSIISKLLFSGVPWVTGLTLVGIILVFSLIYYMIQVTKAEKGSAYGKASHSPKRNGAVSSSAANGKYEDHLQPERVQNSSEEHVKDPLSSKHLHKRNVKENDVS